MPLTFHTWLVMFSDLFSKCILEGISYDASVLLCWKVTTGLLHCHRAMQQIRAKKYFKKRLLFSHFHFDILQRSVSRCSLRNSNFVYHIQTFYNLSEYSIIAIKKYSTTIFFVACLLLFCICDIFLRRLSLKISIRSGFTMYYIKLRS